MDTTLLILCCGFVIGIILFAIVIIGRYHQVKDMEKEMTKSKRSRPNPRAAA